MEEDARTRRRHQVALLHQVLVDVGVSDSVPPVASVVGVGCLRFLWNGASWTVGLA